MPEWRREGGDVRRREPEARARRRRERRRAHRPPNEVGQSVRRRTRRNEGAGHRALPRRALAPDPRGRNRPCGSRRSNPAFWLAIAIRGRVTAWCSRAPRHGRPGSFAPAPPTPRPFCSGRAARTGAGCRTSPPPASPVPAARSGRPSSTGTRPARPATRPPPSASASRLRRRRRCASAAPRPAAPIGTTPSSRAWPRACCCASRRSARTPRACSRPTAARSATRPPGARTATPTGASDATAPAPTGSAACSSPYAPRVATARRSTPPRSPQHVR